MYVFVYVFALGTASPIIQFNLKTSSKLGSPESQEVPKT